MCMYVYCMCVCYDPDCVSCMLFSGRRLAQCRHKLLKMRRGSGHNASFRHNRSFKLKRPDMGKEGAGGGGSTNNSDILII